MGLEILKNKDDAEKVEEHKKEMLNLAVKAILARDEYSSIEDLKKEIVLLAEHFSAFVKSES